MTMVELSKHSEFIQFEVTLNEIPIEKQEQHQSKEFYQKEDEYARGKDVVIDWEFVGVDAGKTFYVDSNGLDMHQRQLWHRKEYTLPNTDNIASNFYPVVSAIAIRDKKSDK